MAVQQALPKRYVDKEKLFAFLRSHGDFRDRQCHLQVSDLWYGRPKARADLRPSANQQVKDDSYLLIVPRELTEVLLRLV
jgi:hypothetical protein